MSSVMSLSNSEILASSFPIWIPFISFSSLIAMSRISKTILNNSGESEHSCLVPDLRGNALSFSPLRMFVVGLSCMTYYVEVHSFYAYFLNCFYYKWVLNFVESFLCIY